MRTIVVLVATVCLTLRAEAQENAQTSVASSLLECYNTTFILTRDYRLPMTINALIDIIRKVENGPSRQDMKMLSVSLLQRFRQDGIIRARDISTISENVIPYSPRGMPFQKHKILLRDMVPGSALQFPNDTLTLLERCTLHHMLSESVDIAERGDEGTVCNRLAHYQRRVRRDLDELPDDVEVIDDFNVIRRGNFQMNPDVDTIPISPLYSASGANPSQCPVEDGVVYTKWGAVSAGALLAGIAAGLEPQTLAINRLTSNNYGLNLEIDNKFGATLAGDLAEVALYQGPTGTTEVGVNGGWNSTQVPKWYFLSKYNNLEMTDAEIRGGLDGLILATNLRDWTSTVPSFKLSQLLDMYYSQKGVFTTDIRACTRNLRYTDVVSDDTLRQQALAFSIVLNDEARLQATMMLQAIQQYSYGAADALKTYVPSLNDVTCVTDDTTIERVVADIVIAIDTTWPFEIIQPVLSYLLDNIDVNPYASNVTVINAKDGSLISNGSQSILTFHETFNQSVYQYYQRGFDLPLTLSNLLLAGQVILESEKAKQPSGGRAQIGLLIPYTDGLSESDRNYANDRRSVLAAQAPDMRVLFLTGGSKETYGDFVSDRNNDIFTLINSYESSTIVQSVSPLITRMKQIPRRIINPNCGSRWSGAASSNQLSQYIEPNGIIFYKIHPNYFFGDGERSVTIRGQTYGSGSVLTICHSRSVLLPRSNTSNSDVYCQQISGNNERTITLTDPCDSVDYINQCAALYFSVQAPLSSQTSASYSCSDDGCRFPDDIKFTITTTGFICTSGSTYLTFSIPLIVLSAVLSVLKK